MESHTSVDRTVGAWRRSPLETKAGIATFLLITSILALFLLSRARPWTATASVVVLPKQSIDPTAAVGYYDTLSRGQIVATFAQVLRLQHFEQEAAASAGILPSQIARSTVTVQVVPDTAMIAITATSPRRAAAEQLADGTLKQAGAYIETLNSPFTVSSVSTAAGSAAQSAASRKALLAAGLVVALISAIAVNRGLRQLRLDRSGTKGTGEPVREVHQTTPPDAALALTLDGAQPVRVDEAPDVGGSPDPVRSSVPEPA